MLNDEAVRAKLERIDIEYALVWDDLLYYDRLGQGTKNTKTSLRVYRLLAESQQALGEIEQKTRKLITHPPSPGPTLSIILANALVAVNKIARNALDGKE